MDDRKMAGPPINLRARASFVPHNRIPWQNRVNASPVPDNIIIKAVSPDQAWIEESTNKIGDWRSFSRSVYLRWALTINASELAEKRYREMSKDNALTTSTLRIVNGCPEQVQLALWPAQEAALRYAETTPLIASYGLADQFGALEDVIFEFYEIYLRHNPLSILEGNEFRDIRRLWHNRSNDDAASLAWKAAWTERYTSWRRKRAYDGLHRVLGALFKHSGLRRPSLYKETDIDDWCRTLEMIAELRNLIIHGSAAVSERLATLSGTPTSLTFNFKAGAELDVKLHHLQSVECFCDQLLTAINLSLAERAYGPISN